jgi:hypothetical protein
MRPAAARAYASAHPLIKWQRIFDADANLGLPFSGPYQPGRFVIFKPAAGTERIFSPTDPRDFLFFPAAFGRLALAAS